jgi:hypothetical protein
VQGVIVAIPRPFEESHEFELEKQKVQRGVESLIQWAKTNKKDLQEYKPADNLSEMDPDETLHIVAEAHGWTVAWHSPKEMLDLLRKKYHLPKTFHACSTGVPARQLGLEEDPGTDQTFAERFQTVATLDLLSPIEVRAPKGILFTEGSGRRWVVPEGKHKDLREDRRKEDVACEKRRTIIKEYLTGNRSNASTRMMELLIKGQEIDPEKTQAILLKLTGEQDLEQGEVSFLRKVNGQIFEENIDLLIDVYKIDDEEAFLTVPGVHPSELLERELRAIPSLPMHETRSRPNLEGALALGQALNLPPLHLTL